ncbi:IS21-like element helper ATPase IstB [Bacteroidota bacterium]
MNEVTMQKMTQMKLYGFHRAFQTLLETNKHHSLTNDEVISLLVQAEWEDRQNRKIKRLLRMARFRYQACVEEIDFTSKRNLDKTQLIRLADCSFIDKGDNLLVTGPTGVGKSYITSAIGNQACLKGYKVVYSNAQKLFRRLAMSKADNSYLKEIDKIEKHDLLILDDFGLEPFDHQSRMMLLEIIEDRHGNKSTLIASQLPVMKWHEVIGESTIADAVMDRLIYGAQRIELKGASMRKNVK